METAVFCLLRVHVHTHTHTCATHAYSCTQTYIHTHIHIHVCIYTYMCTYPHTFTYTPHEWIYQLQVTEPVYLPKGSVCVCVWCVRPALYCSLQRLNGWVWNDFNVRLTGVSNILFGSVKQISHIHNFCCWHCEMRARRSWWRTVDRNEGVGFGSIWVRTFWPPCSWSWTLLPSFPKLWPHSAFLRYLHVNLESRFDSSVLIHI